MITHEEAAVLRALHLGGTEADLIQIGLKHKHMLDVGKERLNDLGLAALAEFDTEKERQIRIKAMQECEAASREVFDSWDNERALGAREVGEAIRTLIVKERKK